MCVCVCAYVCVFFSFFFTLSHNLRRTFWIQYFIRPINKCFFFVNIQTFVCSLWHLSNDKKDFKLILVLYSRAVYENIICFFSFPFITKNVWMRGSSSRAAQIGAEVRICSELVSFSGLDKNLFSNIIFQMPTQTIVVKSFSVRHPRNAHNHASF